MMTAWWQGPAHRLVQMNLREVDGGLDPDRYIDELKRLHATVALLNVGGIVANYPTALDFQYRNPYVSGDLVGAILDRAHHAGLRVMGRFDFSKINQTIAASRPQWLYRSPQGATVCYNGQVHTCPNGEYQRERSTDILGEALDRFDLDGVFFNMIGFVTTDYSGIYHGICHCDACQRRFRDRTGLDLPAEESVRDPAFLRYDAFRRAIVNELFEKINRFVKAKRPSVALSTYADGGVDIRFHESNSDVDRSLPESNFSASDHVKSLTGSFAEKRCNNAAMHFLAHSYRHIGVPPALTAVRLSQNIIHGGWLSFVVVGLLHEQDDRACLPRVRELFGFHKSHHEILGMTRSAARICLVQPTLSAGFGSLVEYNGLFRMLSALRVPFDVIDDTRLDATDLPRGIDEFDVIVLPDTRCVSERACDTMNRYAAGSGSIIATGFPGRFTETGEAAAINRLAWLGVEEVASPVPLPKGSCLRITPADKTRLGVDTLEAYDLAYCIGDFGRCVPGSGTEALFRLIDTVMFGPPEKCYYPSETITPGGFLCPAAHGMHAYLPWNIGTLYERRSHPVHLATIEALLLRADGGPHRLRVLGSSLIEVSHRYEVSGAGEWIGMVNHGGQLGTAFYDPPVLTDVSLTVLPAKPVRAVSALKSGMEIRFGENDDGSISLKVPGIDALEIVRIEYRR